MDIEGTSRFLGATSGLVRFARQPPIAAKPPTIAVWERRTHVGEPVAGAALVSPHAMTAPCRRKLLVTALKSRHEGQHDQRRRDDDVPLGVVAGRNDLDDPDRLCRRDGEHCGSGSECKCDHLAAPLGTYARAR